MITKSGTNRFHGDAWDYYTDERALLADQHREGAAASPKRHVSSATKLGVDIGGPDHQGQGVLLRSFTSATAQRPEPDTRHHCPHDSDACGLCGALERAARRRPDDGEPPGGAASTRVPAGRLLAESGVPQCLHDAGQRRSDRDRADEHQHRRSEHVPHATWDASTIASATATTDPSATT